MNKIANYLHEVWNDYMEFCGEVYARNNYRMF